ncbi:GNAT family N-acetyltransferase [Pseudooceanicola nanhaiensis]|uniref:GNAT family N-acetyltransferase n=1 Tax=Pseudooceanicola nanhaiensis TaxID=375761 RepID=UPI0040581033
MVATHPAFRGRGVGQALLEAMIALARDWLQLSRLQLYVWESNERALELYRSHGFEIEGRLRDYGFVEGKHQDAFIMSILLMPRNNGT